MEPATMPSFILVDGCATTSIPADDRGLHYGDGVFTTARVTNGTVVWLDAHLQRLQRDTAALRMPQFPQLLARTELETAARRLGDGVIKYIVTRGSGPRGYVPPIRPRLCRILLASLLVRHPDHNWTQGISLSCCKLRLHPQPVLAGIKHLNRLEQVLARAELNDSGCAEGLLLDRNGSLVSGIMTNLFFIKGRILHTPDMAEAGVAGVAREQVLSLAPSLGLNIRQGRYTFDQLRSADELFVTNAVIGLWPVVRGDGFQCPIGPITRRIAAALGHPDAGLIGTA